MPQPIDPQVRIGHVHLKVADLERALDFYCGVLGFELTLRYGSQAAFVSAGGFVHRQPLLLNELHGFPFELDRELTTCVRHPGLSFRFHDTLLIERPRNVGKSSASDHGVSEALYLRDPDDNGVELYWDRPPAEWPRSPEGGIHMFTRRLDLDDLLRSAA